MANPSHLEAVNTCVLGKTRAKQLLSVGNGCEVPDCEQQREWERGGQGGTVKSAKCCCSTAFLPPSCLPPQATANSPPPSSLCSAFPTPWDPSQPRSSSRPVFPPRHLPLPPSPRCPQDDLARDKTMGILLHGDGAFSGQVGPGGQAVAGWGAEWWLKAWLEAFEGLTMGEGPETGRQHA